MSKREMPQENRPPRLLNLQLSPASNKAISTLNEHTSPLLKLPAELRTRIFEAAFGGNTIHVVSASPRIFRVRICNHAGDYDDVECRAVMEDTQMNVRKDANKRVPNHEKCLGRRRSHTSTEISLPLLLTCRQLYHEDCLLPFSKNRFVFDSRDRLWYVDILAQFFKRYLNNTQVRAITEVVFDGHHIDATYRGETNALALMQGLHKTGHIFYLHSQSHAASDMFETIAGPLADDQALRTFVETMVSRIRAAGDYAVDFKFIIETWKRQQELYASEFYQNRMREIQQQASAAGQ
jgi:hypothetical protein